MACWPRPRLALLVLSTRTAAGWRHSVGGDVLLVLGGLAAVVAAASGRPVRDLVPSCCS
jgi:hypothetical protein